MSTIAERFATTIHRHHVEEAATWAAHRLNGGLHAHIHLTPGDAAHYDIHIAPPGVAWAGGEVDTRTLPYLVALTMNGAPALGHAWEWDGTTVIWRDLVDCFDEWEARVVAMFLSVVAALLVRPVYRMATDAADIPAVGGSLDDLDGLA
jgi:hypothetical protein